MKARTGGEKGRHLWPRLVQKIAEGKTSYEYELSWKVKVMIYEKEKEKTKHPLNPASPDIRAGLLEGCVDLGAVSTKEFKYSTHTTHIAI